MKFLEWLFTPARDRGRFQVWMFTLPPGYKNGDKIYYRVVGQFSTRAAAVREMESRRRSVSSITHLRVVGDDLDVFHGSDVWVRVGGLESANV